MTERRVVSDDQLLTAIAMIEAWIRKDGAALHTLGGHPAPDEDIGLTAALICIGSIGYGGRPDGAETLARLRTKVLNHEM